MTNGPWVMACAYICVCQQQNRWNQISNSPISPRAQIQTVFSMHSNDFRAHFCVRLHYSYILNCIKNHIQGIGSLKWTYLHQKINGQSKPLFSSIRLGLSFSILKWILEFSFFGMRFGVLITITQNLCVGGFSSLLARFLSFY